MSERIKDIMVQASELSFINTNASLGEAILALGQVVEGFKSGRRCSRVLIVRDDNGRMVGKLSPVDMLRGMEDNSAPVDVNVSSHIGRVSHVIESCTAQMRQASRPWDDLGTVARSKKVSDVMQKLGKSQIISQDESPNEAIHRFAGNSYNNLFVADDEQNLVGVLDRANFYSAMMDKVRQVATTAH